MDKLKYQGGYIGLLALVITISLIGIAFVYINEKQGFLDSTNSTNDIDVKDAPNTPSKNPIEKAQNIKSTIEMRDQKMMQEMPQ